MSVLSRRVVAVLVKQAERSGVLARRCCHRTKVSETSHTTDVGAPGNLCSTKSYSVYCVPRTSLVSRLSPDFTTPKTTSVLLSQGCQQFRRLCTKADDTNRPKDTDRKADDTNELDRNIDDRNELPENSGVDETVPSSGGEVGLGKIQPQMAIQYTCKKCGGRNSNMFSKLAYTKGIVIVMCGHCYSKHLIADNLGWFRHVDHKNIEEILAAHGETVKRITDPEAALEIVEEAEKQKKSPS